MLENKRIIVTGVTSGLGRAITRTLIAEGAYVLGVGRNEMALSALKKELEGNQEKFVPCCCDLTHPDAYQTIVTKAMDHFGRIDGLVNNAGRWLAGTLETTTVADWQAHLQLNVTAVLLLTQACVPYLRQTQGSIVNMSSLTATKVMPGVIAYATSKAALDHLTRLCAIELAADGVRVNAVAPGVVRTQLFEHGGMNVEDTENFFTMHSKTHPLGRIGEPEEISVIVAFLLSEKTSWITGETVVIDGGRALTCSHLEKTVLLKKS